MERSTHKVLTRTEINSTGEVVRTFADLTPPHHPSQFCECDPIKEILLDEKDGDRIVLYIHHHDAPLVRGERP